MVFREGLKRSAPLYVAPAELESSVADLLQPESPQANGEAAGRRPGRMYHALRRCIRRSRLTTVAASLLMLVVAWALVQTFNPSQSMTFAATAVDAHQRYTLGRLPLELTSDSPDRISRWFDGKVPFSLKLPNYQEVSGQDKLYSLKGGRLIGFKNDYAAYVAYQMGEHPISLVVTSSANAATEGGEQIAFKDLTIHYQTISGLKVITWSHRGLTYALVSELDERGQKSCLVCHQGTKDEAFISSLEALELSTGAD